MPKYNYAVFIGRFTPIHKGHLKVIQESLEKADYLIMVVGSANQARNTRNPFTSEERISMIKLATNNDPRIIYTKVNDYPYNEARWIGEVQSVVNKAIEKHSKTADFTDKGWSDYKFSIALTGMHKDETSYYLNSFISWSNSIAILPGSVEGDILSSTGIRQKIFNGELPYDKDLTDEVRNRIMADIQLRPEIWNRLKSDWNYEQKYETLWGKGPHVTVDALVIQAGHILLIQRGSEYGGKLWALPGGFLNRREKILNGCIRELREETRLKVPDKVLFGSVKEVRVYDDPYRSNRSHIITHCHKIVLNNVGKLPDVMGADDAEKAQWVPVSELKNMSGSFFEDHEHIIADFGLTA